jgi:hypothetical protein
MIRTTLSFCALFGSLIFVSKWLHESSRVHARPLVESAQPAEPAASHADEAARCGHEAAAGSEKTANVDDNLVKLTAFEDDSQAEKPAERPAAEVAARPSRNAANAHVEDERSPANSKTPSLGDDPAPADDSKIIPDKTAPRSRDEADIAMSPELIELRDRLRECLAYYYFRPENTALRSPWGAMHAMIAYGVDSQLITGEKRVNAIGYLCYNGVCNGQQLFYTSNGKMQTRIGPGVQGHPGQFLAMLAQSKVKTDFPIRIDGKDFTVADLIQHEKDTCRPKTELTFKLIAFTHYLKSDEKWKSNDGQDWDIPRVIKEELAQPIVGAACGGTHRMTGFSYAFRKRESRGEEFTGQWQRAKKFVEDYHEYAFKLQNPDGSFSTDWFAGRADFGPVSKRLETTGHITEWLTYSLTKEQLVEPRMLKSVTYLTNLLLENRNEKWGIGPLGHGLHALAMYDERIFGGKPGTRADELAEARKKSISR